MQRHCQPGEFYQGLNEASPISIRDFAVDGSRYATELLEALYEEIIHSINCRASCDELVYYLLEKNIEY